MGQLYTGFKAAEKVFFVKRCIWLLGDEAQVKPSDDFCTKALCHCIKGTEGLSEEKFSNERGCCRGSYEDGFFAGIGDPELR